MTLLQAHPTKLTNPPLFMAWLWYFIGKTRQNKKTWIPVSPLSQKKHGKKWLLGSPANRKIRLAYPPLSIPVDSDSFSRLPFLNWAKYFSSQNMGVVSSSSTGTWHSLENTEEIRFLEIVCYFFACTRFRRIWTVLLKKPDVISRKDIVSTKVQLTVAGNLCDLV